MEDDYTRAQYPWWVKFGLCGLPNRSAVLSFAWLSVAAAVGATGYLAWVGHPRWYAGLLFLLAAFWYWQVVRWVDRYGTWQKDFLKQDKGQPRG